MRYTEWLEENQPETPEGYLFYYVNEPHGEKFVEFVYTPKIRSSIPSVVLPKLTVKVELPELLVYLPIPPWCDEEGYAPIEFVSVAINQLESWARVEAASMREMLDKGENR